MKRLLNLAILSVALAAGAAPAPIFIVDSPITLPDAGLPTINTEVFVNQSTFTVSPFSIGIGFGIGFFGFSTAALLPFETFNTRFYTNEASGVMSSSSGFRFLTTTGRTRKPAEVFVNEGSIAGNYLEVKANTIVSTGPMESDAGGLIRLVGKSADLNRTRLRTGQSFFGTIGSGFVDDERREYSNPFGVTDVYWGIGSNGVFSGNGMATRLNSANFNLPSPSTPLHQNQFFFGRRLATNRVALPKFFSFGTNFFTPTNFAAFAYTNTVDGTAAMVQVVFVRTNSADGQLSTDVRFVPSPFVFNAEVDGPAQVIVELKRWDFDPSLDLNITNSFYVSDSMAIRTNLSLYRQVFPTTGTRRPNVYEFAGFQPFEWFNGQPGNTAFTNGLLDVGYLSNRVEMRYAGYSANVLTNIFSLLANGFLLPGVIRPTNLAGRVEVYSDQLNLDSTRIRSESTVLVRTKDLVGNKLPRLVDSPLVGYDLTSKQPEMVVSNLALADVRRLSGTVCAWSGQWKNYVIDTVTTGTNVLTVTNEVNFHVLFVDHDFRNVVPVNVFEFSAHATNLVIADSVNLFPDSGGSLFFFSDPLRNRKLLIDAQSLDVRGSLSFPLGASWAKSNVVGVVNLTNSGTIFVPGSAKYGTDRPQAQPYNCIVNSGTNTAASQLVRTRKFENSGSFIGNSSLVQIDASTSARIEGPPVLLTTNEFPGFFTNVVLSSPGGYIQSFSDLQIKTAELSVSNSLLAAGGIDLSGTFLFPGRLLLSITNRLVDAGPTNATQVIPGYLSVNDDGPIARNFWNCAGFEMRRRPAIGSLLGTWLSTVVPINAQTVHMWPAQDRGAVASGFINNLALGKLTVNISTNNGRAVFRSASGRSAMYVDYVELFNDATNFNRTIGVDPNMTIYFANANVNVSKLNGAVGGRFQWVPTFAGPLSTTNLTYPSGATYSFNIALISSQNIDSNSNGIPNELDPYPIDIPGEVIPPIAPRFLLTSDTTVPPRLSVTLSHKTLPPRAMLSWLAPHYSENTVEFKDSFGETGWSVLTNFVNGPSSAPMQVFDSTTSGATRFYRLQVNPSPVR